MPLELNNSKKRNLYFFYRKLANIKKRSQTNVIFIYASPEEITSTKAVLPKLKDAIKQLTSYINQKFHVGIVYNDMPCIIHQTALQLVK